MTIDELVTLLNIALGNAAVTHCSAGDADGNGQIRIDEILTAVHAALVSCWRLAGSWRINEQVSSSDPDCAGPGTYTLSVTQNGTAITVTDSRGARYQGTINGSTLTADTVPFSYAEGIGTTTVTSVVIAIQSNSSITGSSTWHYSESSFSCSGTTSFTGTKQ